MKKILLSSFVSAVCAMMLACGSDSGTNSGSNGGAINTPSVGNTSAILQPHECEKIMQALPVQPELAYTATYDAEDERCVVTVPDAIDSSAIDNFLTNLYSVAQSFIKYGSKNHYVFNMDVFFYNRSSNFNQISFELYRDCRNAAFAANIPEKDSIWYPEDRCSLYVGKDALYINMTQQQWQDRMAYLVADGWSVTTGCGEGRRLSLLGTDYCFQKQINDYLFELGYGIEDEDMLLRVDVAFAYQKLL